MLGLDVLDRNGLNWFQSQWDPLLDRFFHDVTALGGTPVLSLITVGTVLFLMTQGRRTAAVRFLTSILLAKLCCDGLKWYVARERPDISHPFMIPQPPTNASFPSGHAMLSTVIYGSVVLIVEHYAGPGRGRGFLRGFTLLVILLIGVSRVYLGVHYLTDVVAGWILGGIWLILWHRLLPKQTANGGG